MIFNPNNILIYTDASCSYEKGISACGYVILRDGEMIKHEVLLVSNINTPDEAELFAICKALTVAYQLPLVRRITLNTDSKNIHEQYIQNPIAEKFSNLDRWVKKIRNKGMKFEFNWVRGHGSNYHNNLIDNSCRKVLIAHLKKVG